MTVKLASSSLVFGILCAIATTPLLAITRPGTTQVPPARLAQSAAPGPNLELIPTLDPNAEPPAPIPSPTSPATSPQPKPSPLVSPAPVVPPSPAPAVSPAATPTPQTPPKPTAGSSDNRLSRYATQPPVLTLGSTGEPVQDVQAFLKEAGFYTGVVDGVFGPGTEAAIKKFQESKNLTSDGVVGPETWTLMINS